MDKCSKIGESYKEILGGSDSPLFLSEAACEAAAKAIHKVEGEVRVGIPVKVDNYTTKYVYVKKRQSLTEISTDNRFLLVRKVYKEWVRLYLIPTVRRISEDLKASKINIRQAYYKTMKHTWQKWSGIDLIERKNIFRELAKFATDPKMSPPARLLISKLARGLVSDFEIKDGIPKDRAYFSLLLSSDPYLQLTGLELFSAILGIQKSRNLDKVLGGKRWASLQKMHVSRYHRKVLTIVAYMIDIYNPGGEVLDTALLLLGNAGHILPAKAKKIKQGKVFRTREDIANFLLKLIHSLPTAEKGLIIHALEALDHHDGILWSREMLEKILSVNAKPNDDPRIKRALETAISHYVNARLRSDVILYGSGNFISPRFKDLFAVACHKNLHAGERAKAIIFSLLFNPEVPPQLRKAMLNSGISYLNKPDKTSDEAKLKMLKEQISKAHESPSASKKQK